MNNLLGKISKSHKKTSNYLNSLILLASFLVPMTLLGCVLFWLKIVPFGTNSLLACDANNQYITYMSYLKSMGESHNLFYSFSKSMGGDMLSLFAYYLASPVNFLLFFFEYDKLPMAFTLIFWIKVGLAGLTFNIFLSKSDTSRWESVIFSTAYGMMGYMVTYFYSVMWMDAIVLLPIVILGLKRLILQKKSGLYITALFFTVFTNYYIGFMVCIFTALFFVYEIVSKLIEDKKIKESIKTTVLFAVSSITAILLDAFLLLPVWNSLSGSKAAFSLENLQFVKRFGYTQLLPKLFTGSGDMDQISSGMPNIYVGMVILILLLLYFTNKKIKISERILSFIFVCFLCMNFCIDALNLIWHGLNYPTWFPYRYSFVLSFLMIYLAYRGFVELQEGINFLKILGVVAILLGMAYFVKTKNISYLSIENIKFDVIVILSAGILLGLYYKFKKIKLFILLGLAILEFGGLGKNAYASILYQLETTTEAYDSWESYLRPSIEWIQREDDGFYRIEKTVARTNNDAMQYTYNGLSHYSSSDKIYIREFLGDMGVKNAGNLVFYDGSTTVSADSFLGIKYLVSNYEILNCEYPQIYKEGDIRVYQNPYVLPLVFLADSSIGKINKDQIDFFTLQNKIWSSLETEENDAVFTMEKAANITYENITVTQLETDTMYSKTDLTKDAYIMISVPITSNNKLFMSLTAPSIQAAELYIQGTSAGLCINSLDSNVREIGAYGIGDTIEIKIKLLTENLTLYSYLFAYENLDVIEKNSTDCQKTVCDFIRQSDSYLTGTVEADVKQTLVFSIPYETAWKIKIDGKTVAGYEVCGALLAVDLEKGSHSIEIRYVPKGFFLGTTMSLTTFTLIMVFYVFLVKKTKKDIKIL